MKLRLRTGLASIWFSISLSCGSPPPPSPATPASATSDAPPSASSFDGPPVAEGRLLIDDKDVCAALRTGVFCRSTADVDAHDGHARQLTDARDIVGLVKGSRVVCGRSRRGPASCWEAIGAPQPSWPLASPAIATSVAASSADEVCATGEDGDLWCARYREKEQRVETPEPIAIVKRVERHGVCVLGRSGAAYCREGIDRGWNEAREVAHRFSPTIACTPVRAREPGALCAYRDARDEIAIQRAGHSAVQKFADAIDTAEHPTVPAMLRADGRLEQNDEDNWSKLFADSPTPVPAGAIEHEAGPYSECVLTSADEVWCHGRNLEWQLGRGSAPEVFTPIRVLGEPVDEVLASSNVTCARTGEQWRCAETGEYQPAHAPAGGVPSRLRETDGEPAMGCAERKGGKHVCWSDVDRPAKRVVGDVKLRGPIRFSSSSDSACVVDATGGLWCWGQHGCALLTDRERFADPRCTDGRGVALPMKVVGAPPARAVAVGSYHLCVVTTKSEVACAGSNARGELGEPARKKTDWTFAVVPGLDDAQSIAAGTAHTCALRGDRSLMCWGDNRDGQLGAGRVPSVDRWARWPTGAAEAGLGEVPTLVTGARQEDADRIGPPPGAMKRDSKRRVPTKVEEKKE